MLVRAADIIEEMDEELLHAEAERDAYKYVYDDLYAKVAGIEVPQIEEKQVTRLENNISKSFRDENRQKRLEELKQKKIDIMIKKNNITERLK